MADVVGYAVPVLIWILLASLVGRVTKAKGRGYGEGFFVSLLLSPLIGFLFAIAMPKKEVAAPPSMKVRPADVPRKKVTCPHCGGAFVRPGETCAACGK